MPASAETRPAVSILILNYNTPRLVRTLVESILKNLGSISYEVLILNNGCRPGFLVTPNDLPAKGIIVEASESNLGFAAGCNRLATKARGDYLLFANSDCEITADIVTPMVQYLQHKPDCAACSPRTLYPDGRPCSTIRRMPTHANIGRSRGAVLKVGKGDYTLEADESRKSVEAMAATFMLITTNTFRQLGGFDERFFMYVEDTDLCKRLHAAGYDLAYLGDLTVRHQWGASTKQHPLRMKFHQHKSVWLFFRKHYPEKRLANLWLGVKLMINLAIVSVLQLFRRREEA